MFAYAGSVFMGQLAKIRNLAGGKGICRGVGPGSRPGRAEDAWPCLNPGRQLTGGLRNLTKVDL
jgi:hypothetical protein